MSLAEVAATIPWGWEVFETTSGRYLFWNKDPNVSIDAAVFWDHPDASIDPSTYLPPKVERSPKYEALSYTWGTDTNPSTILVDEGPEKPVTALGVGPNLMEALRHLQPGDATTTRILWIDAICINQADTMEKSVQVQLMGSIYKQAHRVVIWLGPEEDDSSLALSEIKRFGEQVEYSMSTDNRFVSPGAKHLDWFKRAIPLPFDSNACRAINDLFWRSWFDRLWVVQEVQLASKESIVQCGHSYVSLPVWLASVACFIHKLGDFLPKIQNVHNICVSDELMGLRTLLVRLSAKQCRDERDKIYGLLQLFPPAFREKIHPDYNMTADDLFKQIVLLHAQHVGRFELFFDNLLPPGQESRASHPSWVPDWSLEGGYWRVPFCQSAAGCSRAHYTSNDSGILEVAGIMCGTVATAYSKVLWDDLEDGEVLIDKIRSWRPDDFDKGVYPTGEAVSAAHIANLTELRYAEHWKREFGYPSLEEYMNSAYLAAEEDFKLPRNDQDRFDDNITALAVGRRYIRTDDGYLGLVPHYTEPGKQWNETQL